MTENLSKQEIKHQMTHLKEGDNAPAISGLDQDNKERSWDEFKGKRTILFFYPKDNTPGCTAEACNLRDNYQGLMDQGFSVVGVSADSVKKHQNFVSKYELPFPLIADTERQVIEQYGVWGEKKMYGKTFEGIFRTTFVIDTAGKIEKVISKVDTKNHTEQILQELGLN